jgi:DNA anti-recombination protein RmuC
MLDNVTTIDKHRDREEIDQVRNLLFGELQRENQRRLDDLEKRIENLRQSMERRFSTMAADNTTSKAEMIRAMGDAITELGRQITQLADSPSGDMSSHE